MLTSAFIQARIADARRLPSYLKPVLSFDDDATGRYCLWAKLNGEDWLFWKHPDGQWVSWRKLMERDRASLTPLLERAPDWARFQFTTLRLTSEQVRYIRGLVRYDRSIGEELPEDDHSFDDIHAMADSVLAVIDDAFPVETVTAGG